jgi:uncharacterized membrane protein
MTSAARKGHGRPGRWVAWPALGLLAGLATAAVPVGVAPPTNGFWDAVGRLHPFLVHFPVALVLFAALAEILAVVRRDARMSDAARFMITGAAWVAVPAAIAGFARADAISIPPALAGAFAVHRIAGIATPVLAFLAAGLAAGVRRSGQIWELFLYRAVLMLAAVCAALAGHFGGEIVFGAGFFPFW